jgi:hypothetical protein
MSSVQNRNPVRSLAVRVVLTALATAFVMAVVVIAMSSFENAFSVAVGSAVAIASFLVLVAVVTKTLTPSTWPQAVIVGIGFLKLGILGVILWWLVSNKHVEPITFLAGFSSVVVALLIEGVRGRRQSG